MEHATKRRAAGEGEHPGLALIGRWRLVRRIEDFRAGTEAGFDGEATLGPVAAPSPASGGIEPPLSGVDEAVPAAPTLMWREAGTLRLGAHVSAASRVYLWRLIAPDLLDVAYQDGRPFHRVALPRVGEALASHDCAPDRYDGAYTFQGPDRWTLVWRVRGPRKDYRMITEHTRIAPDQAGARSPSAAASNSRV
jgi:hypothetical protein